MSRTDHDVGHGSRSHGAERVPFACMRPTDEAIRAMRLAASELPTPLRAADYDRLAQERGWPRYKEVVSVLGSPWPVALRAAGIEPAPGPAQAWSRLDCVTAVSRVWEQLGEPPSLQRYQETYREAVRLMPIAPTIPSPTTITRRLGGPWSNVLAIVEQARES
jgi:hypothetical protein